jgi:uncharacterized protein YciI
MRHFIVLLDFLAPFAAFGDAIPAHGAFLKEGYDDGLLLISGPLPTRTGGAVVCRAANLDAVKDYFARDPFKVQGLAEYRFIEFEANQSQALLADWVG